MQICVTGMIERLLRVAGRFFASGQISSSPTPLIRGALKDMPSVFFVQVGSNDGVSGDPLHDLILQNPSWKGIFIEPVDYLFDRLVRQYGRSERFVFEQIAIADEIGERDFYFVSEMAAKDPAATPFWNQLGSFRKSHITEHQAALEKYIQSCKVQCETIGSVLRKHNVQSLDILHIDVEGFDYHVLRQVDFSKYQPRVILFEHAHLNQQELDASRRLLGDHGYRLINCGLDTLAINDKPTRSAK